MSLKIHIRCKNRYILHNTGDRRFCKLNYLPIIYSCLPATVLALWLSLGSYSNRRPNETHPYLPLSQGLNIDWNVSTQLNQRTTILWDTHWCMNINPPVYTHTHTHIVLCTLQGVSAVWETLSFSLLTATLNSTHHSDTHTHTLSHTHTHVYTE